MKIGINSRMYQNAKTGIPYYIEKLYTICQKLDKENEYIFFQTNKKRVLGKTLIKSLNNSPLQAFLFDNFFIMSLIRNSQVSVFHGPSGILPIIKKRNIKYIVTIHDLSFLVFPQNQSKIFNIYYKVFMGHSLRKADIIVADSNNTKKDIIKFYKIPESKISVVYLGVNNITKQNNSNRIIKNKYFFTLSTHPKRKNIYRIIDIIFDNPEFMEYSFVIAGLIPPDQQKELIAIIKEKKLTKNIIIFGYASEEELMNLYTHAEFFIYPSYYEGFGFPVLEAMISKCPVIASNTSSIPEIVPDEKWLFNPYDSSDIANKMKVILDLSPSEKKQLIEKNYMFANKFTWERTASEMMELFAI